MKKIIIVGVSLMMLFCLVTPSALGSDTTITGEFDANATLDVDVGNSSPTFGSIEAGTHSTVQLSVTNNGQVLADVTQDQAVKDSGSMTIGTNGSLTIDQYAVMMHNGTSETDIGQNNGAVIVTSLAKDATHFYNMTVWIADSLGAEAHPSEQFSIDVTVLVHT